MKTAVAVTLIICGVVVVAIPALCHAWDAFMTSNALAHMQTAGSFNMNFGPLPDLYQLACWVLGAAMIAVAVIASILTRTEASPSQLTMSH